MARDYLDEAATELYAGDPGVFTGRRAELSKQARAAGDADAARSIAALRRPTRSADLVNRLVREHADLFDELLTVGQELRSAQDRLDGTELRSMGARRRQVVSAAVRAALRGESASEAIRAEVTATLEAALADPDVAGQVSAATLSRPMEWSAFGSVGPALSVVPPAAPSRAEQHAAKDRAAAAAAAAAQRAKVVEAERAKTAEAHADVRSAQEAVTASSKRRDAAAGRVTELETQLAQARLDLRACAAQLRSAQERTTAAERRLRRLGPSSSA